MQNVPDEILEYLGLLLDVTARGLDVADRLTLARDVDDPSRAERYDRAIAGVRDMVLRIADPDVPSPGAASVPSPGVPVPRVPSAPAPGAASAPAPGVPVPVPGAASAPAPGVPSEGVAFGPPDEGETAWEYVARTAFGDGQFPTSVVGGPDWVCWVEETHDPYSGPSGSEEWLPPGAAPKSTSARMIERDGRPYTAFALGVEIMSIAATSPYDVFAVGGWEREALFI